LSQSFLVLTSLPGNKTIKVVAKRAKGPKVLLVKEPLDATAQTNLVGVLLDANRPTHFAMPTPAQDHDSGAGYTGSDNAKRPLPARLFVLFTHPPQPVTASKI
jgi:hypothetical protein